MGEVVVAHAGRAEWSPLTDTSIRSTCLSALTGCPLEQMVQRKALEGVSHFQQKEHRQTYLGLSQLLSAGAGAMEEAHRRLGRGVISLVEVKVVSAQATRFLTVRLLLRLRIERGRRVGAPRCLGPAESGRAPE